MRRTKIVATIGPSSDSLDALNALVTAGVDVFRLSFAHGDIPSCIERLRRVRTAAPHAAIACSSASLRSALLGYQATNTSIAVARRAGSRWASAAWNASYSAGLAKLERFWAASSTEKPESSRVNTRTMRRTTPGRLPSPGLT